MNRIFTLGICAMANKVESAPMRSILHHLRATGDFEIIIFPEETILHLPVTEWPIVECLIAFYSTNFPLEKAIDYVRRYKPIVLNDVERQRVFKSRLEIYRELQLCHIPHPNYVVVDHDAVRMGKATFEENEDYIVYNNVKLKKPFIEKPVDADNHNNWIYYPTNTGGGCKKLFRKVHDRSSQYCADINTVRRDGTYIYEEFMSTFGTDIKVYTVGCMFAHAEARKSPTLDGKVNRNTDGKEVRYPVILTAKEKIIAYRIVEHFRQVVCGFDILRTINGPYVCDINGWSFVKHSRHHTDLSQIIRIMFLLKLQMKYNITLDKVIPARIITNETVEALKKTFVDIDQTIDRSESQEELCSVVVVMRHADRKPKQKVKVMTQHPLILGYFDGVTDKQINLKAPEDMRRFTAINKIILEELEGEMLMCNSPTYSDDSSDTENPQTRTLSERLTLHKEMGNMLNTSEGFAGINRKIQLKAKFDDEGKVQQVLVVAKWGGELTSVGQCQAEDLGRRFRQSLYPTDCTGLVRLHSTYRHDFKIFTSNEGRCQLTSAAFTKGILDLEGELTPILVAMTIRDKRAQMLLDDNIEVRERNQCKNRLSSLMENWGNKYEVDKLLRNMDADEAKYYRKALEKMNFQNEDMNRLNKLLNDFMNSLDHEITKWMYLYSVDEYATSVLEILQDMATRWKNLTAKLYKGSDCKFQYTMVADIVDNLRYDLIHHHTYLGSGLDTAFDIYNLVGPLSAILSPCEYGVTPRERLTIGMKVAGRLLQKIVHDVTLHKNSRDVTNKAVYQQRNRDQLYAKLVEQNAICHERRNSIHEGFDEYYGNKLPHERTSSEPSDFVPKSEKLDIQNMVHTNTGDPLKKISLIASTSASAASVAASSIALGSDGINCIPDHSRMTFIGGIKPNEMKYSCRTNMEEIWDLLTSGASLPEPVEINSGGTMTLSRTKSREHYSDDMDNTSSSDDSDIVRQEVSEARKMSSDRSHRMVRSRYYVTSASILFSLLNFLKYAHYLDDDADNSEPLVHYNTRDLHYLSHVVLRVWWSCKENGVPKYRVEILVSPGARDGFGQNYDILASNARSQKHKYRRHISRFNLDYVRGQVLCKHCGDVIDPAFVRAQFMDNIRVKSYQSGMRRSASTANLQYMTKYVKGAELEFDPKGAATDNAASRESARKGSWWYRCQRCAASNVSAIIRAASNVKSTRSSTASERSDSPVKSRSTSSSRDASFSPTFGFTDEQLKQHRSDNGAAVPPYCELSRLAIINYNCDINRLEQLVNKAAKFIL